MHFGVWLGNEFADFHFALGEDGEGGCLHSSGSGNIKSSMAGAETGQCAGRVQTDEPV